MNVILKTIANWFYKHGKANAGMASIRGAYEAPVPQQLQEQEQQLQRQEQQLQELVPLQEQLQELERLLLQELL